MFVRRILNFQVAALQVMARKVYQPPHERRCRAWFAVNGDKTLRLDYDLNEDSVVFDLGGYEGQWASDIFSRYCCWILIFEPVHEFAKFIQTRLLRNKKIKVFTFGLAQEDRTNTIWLNQDASSLYSGDGSQACVIQLRRASDFLKEQGIEHIDLMKINIEGGEYDLLDHLIETEYVRRINNIQIQFHDFVPDAEKRMVQIQKNLSNTHYLSYQYPFVWENWKRK